MKMNIKMKLLTVAFVGGTSLFGRHLSFGIGTGEPRGYYTPPPPRALYSYAPARPGPGYVLVDGYWEYTGRGYSWRPGYWAQAPYAGARWVAPRYRNRNFYNGYWRR